MRSGQEFVMSVQPDRDMGIRLRRYFDDPDTNFRYEMREVSAGWHSIPHPYNPNLAFRATSKDNSDKVFITGDELTLISIGSFGLESIKSVPERIDSFLSFNDVATIGENIYVITNEELHEYDKRNDRWFAYAGEPKMQNLDMIDDILYISGDTFQSFNERGIHQEELAISQNDITIFNQLFTDFSQGGLDCTDPDCAGKTGSTGSACCLTKEDCPGSGAACINNQCQETSCLQDGDDDGDGLSDCEDPDCNKQICEGEGRSAKQCREFECKELPKAQQAQAQAAPVRQIFSYSNILEELSQCQVIKEVGVCSDICAAQNQLCLFADAGRSSCATQASKCTCC